MPTQKKSPDRQAMSTGT